MGDVEQKYIFLAQQKSLIHDWLDFHCVRDPKYYSSVVSTVYFDTPQLQLYREKRNGDYLKSKIRLRWYEDWREMKPGKTVCGFLELKRRVGVLRQKERIEVSLSSQSLLDNPLKNKEIMELPVLMKQTAENLPEMLAPMLHIQYNRYRFVDPQSASRVSLDTDICCLNVNDDYLAGFPPIFLDAGVMEFKGTNRELPATFLPIMDYITKDAFSKYARCFEHLMQPINRVV